MENLNRLLSYDISPTYKDGEIYFAKKIVSNMELKNINRYEYYKVFLSLIIDENGNILDVIILEKYDKKKDRKNRSSIEREVI